MAYDQYFAERIGRSLDEFGVAYQQKKMFGGLCFMVRGNMLCGPMFNKKLNKEVLMIRLGAETAERSVTAPGALPMDFTGRPMKGYLFVEAAHLDLETDLNRWLKEALAFNETLPAK